MKTVHVYGECSGRQWTVKVRNRAECRAAGETDVPAEGDWWETGEAEATRAGESIRLTYHSRRGGMTQRFEPAGRDAGDLVEVDARAHPWTWCQRGRERARWTPETGRLERQTV